MCYWSLGLMFKTKLELSVRKLAAILKVTLLKINSFLPIHTSYPPMRLGLDIQESGNRKKQYGHQATILEGTSPKIDTLLPIATNKMHVKFEIEIPKANLCYAPETMSSTDGRTDRRTDGQCKLSITPHPHPSSQHSGRLKIEERYKHNSMDGHEFEFTNYICD